MTNCYTRQDLLSLIDNSFLTVIGYSGSNYIQFISLIDTIPHVRLPVDTLDQKQAIRMARIDMLLDIDRFYLIDSYDLLNFTKDRIEKLTEVSLLLKKSGVKCIITIPYYKSFSGKGIAEEYKMKSSNGLLYKADLFLQIIDKDIKVIKSKYKLPYENTL